jgi:trans-2,3-dihydro-3-hydroxyanthranilate isomerase
MAQPRTFRYRVVDVFTEQPLEGNALAVFPDASAIDEVTMQKIAKELNLSETTFVLPPSQAACAARVRIFTPSKEMVFAGHPTIGTSFVMLEEGIVPQQIGQFLLEEKIGPVPVRVERVQLDSGERPMIWLTTPTIQEGRTFDPALCASALGLQKSDLLEPVPQLLSAGNPTIFIALRDKGAVDRASLEVAGSRALTHAGEGPACVFVFAPTLEGAYSRMFAPEFGIVEDPATGSATGPLAAFMMRHKLAPGAGGSRFISEQGTRMGRRSFLHVHVLGDQGSEGIEVGGYVTSLVEASMTF